MSLFIISFGRSLQVATFMRVESVSVCRDDYGSEFRSSAAGLREVCAFVQARQLMTFTCIDFIAAEGRIGVANQFSSNGH